VTFRITLCTPSPKLSGWGIAAAPIAAVKMATATNPDIVEKYLQSIASGQIIRNFFGSNNGYS